MFDSNFILNDILFQYGGSTRRKGKEGGHPWDHGLATGSGPARTVDRHHTTVVM